MEKYTSNYSYTWGPSYSPPRTSYDTSYYTIKVLILSASRAQIRFMMGVVMERHIIPFQITSGSMHIHNCTSMMGGQERRERENKNV